MQDQLCPQASSAVLRINVDLLEVRCLALNYLNMRKAHGYVVHQCDP